MDEDTSFTALFLCRTKTKLDESPSESKSRHCLKCATITLCLSSSRQRASISHKRLIKWFAMVIANKVASGLVNRVEQEQNIFKSITILLKINQKSPNCMILQHD